MTIACRIALPTSKITMSSRMQLRMTAAGHVSSRRQVVASEAEMQQQGSQHVWSGWANACARLLFLVDAAIQYVVCVAWLPCADFFGSVMVNGGRPGIRLSPFLAAQAARTAAADAAADPTGPVSSNLELKKGSPLSLFAGRPSRWSMDGLPDCRRLDPLESVRLQSAQTHRLCRRVS